MEVTNPRVRVSGAEMRSLVERRALSRHAGQRDCQE
jgi:hypothetical protein